MKKVLLFIFMLTLIMGMSVCSAAVDWNSNTISAVGTGVVPDYATSPGQGQALARRAAVVDAYRNLAEIIYGTQVENNTTIEQLAVKKDTVKTSVSGLIRNARITDEEKMDNGTYQVTMTIQVFGEQNSLAATVWQDKGPAIPTPDPDTKVDTVYSPISDSNVPINTVTGVVIDCRGLGLERAMAPNILDTNGRKLYTSKYVSADFIVSQGLASYSKTDNPSDLTRAGSNPLVIKAISLDDFNRNPVVSKEDGDKILYANQLSNFLRRCPVVFIE